MAAEGVEEDVAHGDGADEHRIEPEEHARALARPEVLGDPLDKAAVQQGFIEDVNRE